MMMSGYFLESSTMKAFLEVISFPVGEIQFLVVYRLTGPCDAYLPLAFENRQQIQEKQENKNDGHGDLDKKYTEGSADEGNAERVICEAQKDFREAACFEIIDAIQLYDGDDECAHAVHRCDVIRKMKGKKSQEEHRLEPDKLSNNRREEKPNCK